MAPITAILDLSGTRGHPFDIILTTLACQPQPVPYTSRRPGMSITAEDIYETKKKRQRMQRKWIETCAEATKWQQVCRKWRDCHHDHIAIGSRWLYYGYIGAMWWQQAPYSIKHMYTAPERTQTPVPPRLRAAILDAFMDAIRTPNTVLPSSRAMASMDALQRQLEAAQRSSYENDHRSDADQ